MHRRSFLAHAGLLAVAVSACGRRGAPIETASASRTVLDVARAHGGARFAAALGDSGLSEQLSGAGPFTLFAPSDRALAPLPADADAREQLLAYHVVPGMLPSGFLEGMEMNHTTATGASLTVDGTAGLRVNDANVLAADLRAENGIVYIIDRVLTPR